MMADHHIIVVGDPHGELDIKLVCTAQQGDPCKLRPADGREEWRYGDRDLIPSEECWATEWFFSGGLESVMVDPDYDGSALIAYGAVTVTCDEGVLIRPIGKTLDDVQSIASELHMSEAAVVSVLRAAEVPLEDGA